MLNLEMPFLLCLPIAEKQSKNVESLAYRYAGSKDFFISMRFLWQEIWVNYEHIELGT